MDEQMNHGLPVAGYTAQSDVKVALVNRYKVLEERVLREIDDLLKPNADGAAICDPRWAAVARTHMQEGFMALNRSVFQPTRIMLPEDNQTPSAAAA